MASGEVARLALLPIFIHFRLSLFPFWKRSFQRQREREGRRIEGESEFRHAISDRVGKGKMLFSGC